MSNPIKIKEGDVITFDTLRWNDGWEFDCPSMILRPVIRCCEDGSHCEGMVEDVMMDAVCGNNILPTEDFETQWGWRRYNLNTLRRRFREALAGKRFPVAHYFAERMTVKVVKDDDGELTWETVSE